MKKHELTPEELDRVFQQAQIAPAAPRPAFLDHLADQAVQSLATPEFSQDASGLSWLKLRDLLGGWRGLGGLMAATMTGVWLGLAAPDVLIEQVSTWDTAWSIDEQGYGAGFGLGATDWVLSEDG